MPAAVRLIGVDGCPGGWIVALEFADRSIAMDRWQSDRLGAVSRRSTVQAVVIDIPVGVPASGARSCDREARQLLGKARQASVFPAPSRPMLAATSYQQAQRIRQLTEGKGCSRQAFGIQAKVKEIDSLLRLGAAAKLHEGHPELTFRELAGGRASAASKHTPEGRDLRRQLLAPHFPQMPWLDLGSARKEDALDALACLWTARRIAAGKAKWVPWRTDEIDRMLDMPMRIWY